jgi:hypothetical protein
MNHKNCLDIGGLFLLFWVACNIVNLCKFLLGVGYYFPWMLDSLYNASKSLFEYTKDYGLQNLYCCFLQVWNHVYTIFGKLKKKDQDLLTIMMVVLVFIFVVLKKIKGLVLIYIIAFLNFEKSQTTTNKTNSFFMKTTNSLRFLK